MPSIQSLVARHDHTENGGTSSTTVDLLVALVVLLGAIIALTATLFGIRALRKSKAAKRSSLPMYNEAVGSSPPDFTFSPSGKGSRASSIYVYNEKASMVANSSSPPQSPEVIPEIRITFPDEQDEGGKRKSGRVVVVRVGETGVGLEPLKEDALPAYQKSEGLNRFQSLDLERIGGLKEKSSQS